MTKGSEAESTYAWVRLAAALAISTIGGVGMWSVRRGAADGAGGVRRRARRRVAALHADDDRLRHRRHPDGPALRPLRHRGAGRDRRDRARRRLRRSPASATSLWQFALVARPADRLPRQLGDVRAAGRRHLALVRRAAAASRWRSCASGNYLAGAVWPPVVQHFVETAGWRQTYFGIGVFCAAVMLPLALAAAPAAAGARARAGGARAAASGSARPLGLSPGALQGLLIVAGLACCVAMSMPQVHIVAYCGDLGYGAARGARDAVADARLRHRQPPRLGLDLRPHRRAAHAAARLGAAGRRAAALPAVRRARLALRDLGAVRTLPGRHRAVLRDHRARVLPAAGGRHARRHGDHGDAVRHGARRLDVRRDLRPDRLVHTRRS